MRTQSYALSLKVTLTIKRLDINEFSFFSSIFSAIFNKEYINSRKKTKCGITFTKSLTESKKGKVNTQNSTF